MISEGLLGTGSKLIVAFAVGSMAALRSVTEKLPIKRAASSTPNEASSSDEKHALSPEAQWDRVSGVVNSEITRARQAADLQSAAAEQLDAASYTFTRIMEEISGTMTETRKDVSKLKEQNEQTEREFFSAPEIKQQPSEPQKPEESIQSGRAAA